MTASQAFHSSLFSAVATTAGAAYVLLVAGALRRERRRRHHPEERALIVPAATAIIVITLFLLAMFAGGVVLAAATGILGLIAVREYARLARLGRSYSAVLAVWLIAGLALAVVVSVQWLLLLPVGLFLSATLIPITSGKITDSHRQVSSTAFGYLYIGLPLAYVVFIRSAEPWGLRFLLATCAAVWLTDAFGYTFGSRIQGPRLAPTVSPGKTWSGAVAGVLGAVAGVAAMSVIIPLRFPLSQLLPLAAVTSLCAIWSDLVESFVKRDFKVKDAGSAMPGFGGVLDRFDSLLLSIPVAYYVMLGLRHLGR